MHSFGVYISQLIRYSRTCAQYSDFLDRTKLLTQKLLKQGYVEPKLKSSIQTFSTVDITIWLTVTKYPYLKGNGYFTFYVDDVVFPLSLPRPLPDLTVYMSNTAGVL